MRTIIILFFVLLSLSADAQMKGKVLISCPDSTHYTYFINPLDSIIPLYYKGITEVKFGTLPDSLENYDAIFLSAFYNSDEDSLLTQETNKILHFLRNGGNIFIDLPFIGSALKLDTLQQDIKDVLGIEDLFIASMFLYEVGHIYGIDSAFTKGLSIYRKTNPFDEASSSLLDLKGEITPILKAQGSSLVNMAWAFTKDNHKSIVHWQIANNHLPRFIGLVLCNYFNLCTPLSVGNDIAPNSFQITNPTYIRNRNELLFIYESPSVTKLDVSVYNILGERVYYSYDNDVSSTSGEMRIRLNSGLASGGYFLVAKSADGVARKPFFVIN